MPMTLMVDDTTRLTMVMATLCSEDDDSDDERNRNAEDKETEIMEDLALAQAMEPQTDVSLVHRVCALVDPS